MKKALKNCIALAFWFAVWELFSLAVGSELLLPGPVKVCARLLSLAGGAQFWRICAVSMLRIVTGAASALILGTLLAVLTSRFEAAKVLFSPLLTVIKSTPVASFIILALIIIGRNTVPAFISGLIVLPVVWSNVSSGIECVDSRLLEVAKVFGFSRSKTLKKLYIPSVMPSFLAACRSSLGLAWKAGIAAEVLTVPGNAVGRMLYETKLYLETTDLFAWTLAVIVFSLVIEKLLTSLISRLGRRYDTEVRHDRH